MKQDIGTRFNRTFTTDGQADDVLERSSFYKKIRFTWKRREVLGAIKTAADIH